MPPLVNRAMVTTLSPGSIPRSAASVGQPSALAALSCSARTTRHVCPNVLLSAPPGRKPATLRRYSRRKRPTARVGPIAVTQGGLFAVEAEHRYHRAAQHDEGVAPGRVPAVLDAVARVGQHLGDGDEHRPCTRGGNRP